ncbi:hypothetical protein [Staphylococcus gallinarum]|uniref:hypothetical protein n=1 Tax=Staphylococcus gallinarum TaxID=1293 RepID=UPI00317DC0E4
MTILEFNEFNNRITFFQYKHKGPYPEDVKQVNLYSCFCKIYNPSNKDIQILQDKGSKLGFTLIMRNAFPKFYPENKHIVKVDSGPFTSEEFNVEEIRNNKPQKGYITVVLSQK